MLYNISYPDARINQEIEGLVGGSYSLIERLKMKGIGSPRLAIIDASTRIQELIDTDLNQSQCSVELRKNGVLIRFRILLDTYCLAVPYPKLTIYQNAAIWSFHADGEYLRVSPESNSKSNRQFLIKLMGEKAKWTQGPE